MLGRRVVPRTTTGSLFGSGASTALSFARDSYPHGRQDAQRPLTSRRSLRIQLASVQPPHRIERNPFDRDGKGLTEEFCESKAITLIKPFLLFLSAATFT